MNKNLKRSVKFFSKSINVTSKTPATFLFYNLDTANVKIYMKKFDRINTKFGYKI